MCGFLGVFGDYPAAAKTGLETALGDTLRHRGPDDFQTLSSQDSQLWFWRLSIVDRTAGKQPMVSSDHSVTVVFNGEIYNFLTLREQLQTAGYQFRTKCDTEVILAAYVIWGEQGFDRFEGMFAICLIDHRSRQIVLARDRLGIKPLYYGQSAQNLWVASEQKAMFVDSGLQPELDRDALHHYLLFQTILDNRTLFRGIKKVLPGTVVILDQDSQKVKSQRRIGRLRKFADIQSAEQACALARQVIRENVELTFQTDLPFCFHLSGGTDSNLLVALHRYLYPGRDIVCFSSLVEGEQDVEWDFIRKSVDIHKCLLRTVDLNAEIFFESLDDVLFYLDEPVGDPGVVAQFLVNKMCAEHGKIVFSGQGVDELFFGYIRDLAGHVWDHHGKSALAPGSDAFNALNDETRGFFHGWEGFLNSMNASNVVDPAFGFFRKLCRMDPYDVPLNGGGSARFFGKLREIGDETFRELKRQSSDMQGFMLNAETAIQLPALLHMEDRASMRHSVESRVPFCNSSMFDLAQSLDSRWKFVDGSPKGLVKESFRDILPPHVTKRRQKVGRPIPLHRWLNEPCGQPFQERMQGSRELFLDLTGVDLVDRAFNSTNPYDRQKWAVLSISRWIDAYGVSV